MPSSVLLIASNIGLARAIVRPAAWSHLASAGAGIQAPGQYPFLRVQAIFGFTEDHRMGAIHHFVGDLLATMRRQAMHEDGIRLGARHEPAVDLVALEHVVAGGARGG